MKHFIIYYKQGTGSYVITEPRPWARENQQHFPTYDFINNEPNTITIRDFLIDNFDFEFNQFPERNISVLSNLSPNLNL